MMTSSLVHYLDSVLGNYAFLPTERELQQFIKDRSSSPSDDDPFFYQEYNDIMNRIKEEPIDNCAGSVSPYPANDNEQSSSVYSNSLTILEPYKPDPDLPSSGVSTLMFARTVPLLQNGHATSPNGEDDDVDHIDNVTTLQQVVLENENTERYSPISEDVHQMQSGSFHHPGSRGFDVVENGFNFVQASPSSSAEGTSSSSSPLPNNCWSSSPLPVINGIHNGTSSTTSYWFTTQNDMNSAMTTNVSGMVGLQQPSPRLDLMSRECVVCGMGASYTWWPDGTGHFMCGNCKNENHQNHHQRHANIHHQQHTLHQKQKVSRRPAGKKVNQECTNCKTNRTSLWRRKPSGETVCNACGLYFKLHKRDRPLTMRKDTIQKRKRKTKVKRDKDLSTPPMTPKTIESGNGHVNMVSQSSQILANRGVIIEQGHHQMPKYVGQGIAQALPHVHSPDGFRNPLMRFDSPSSFSPSATMIYNKMPSPLMSNGSITYSNSSPSASPPTSVVSSYLSPTASIIPSPTPSPSPTMTTLLPSRVTLMQGNEPVISQQHSFLQSPVSDHINGQSYSSE